MLTRMRLVKGLAALLYIGPLIAGLSGLGWDMVAPFAAIFVVWLMVLRPSNGRQPPSEWLTGQAWLAALAQVLSQVASGRRPAWHRARPWRGGEHRRRSSTDPAAGRLLPVPSRSAGCSGIRERGRQPGYFLDDEAEAAHATMRCGQAASGDHSASQPADDTADPTPGGPRRCQGAGRARRRPAAERACRRALASGPQSCRAAPGARALGDRTGNRCPGRVEWRHGQRLRDCRAEHRSLAPVCAARPCADRGFPNRASCFPTPERLRKAASEADFPLTRSRIFPPICARIFTTACWPLPAQSKRLWPPRPKRPSLR
jgi:hypothetical protein